MDEWLAAAITELDIAEQTAALATSSEYSNSIIETARNELTAAVPPDGNTDVIVFGSYARREASETSDFDYLIVTNSLPAEGDILRTRDLLRAVESFMIKLEKTADEPKKPGATGLFGKIQSAPDLVERIGLEQDTNTTHTRRCLVLQESVSIYHPELHGKLVSSTLARYLADYNTPKAGPPRFLLNDLNRYWFTVAVDYQAKRWERLSHGWGIRYLKLLISRRLSYVGALVPLLLRSEDEPADQASLVEAFARPALARVASLIQQPGFEEKDQLAQVLISASRFNEVISVKELRDQLDQVGPEPVEGESAIFDEMHALTKTLERALREIFGGSVLHDLAHKYLIL